MHIICKRTECIPLNVILKNLYFTDINDLESIFNESNINYGFIQIYEETEPMFKNTFYNEDEYITLLPITRQLKFIEMLDSSNDNNNRFITLIDGDTLYHYNINNNTQIDNFILEFNRNNDNIFYCLKSDFDKYKLLFHSGLNKDKIDERKIISYLKMITALYVEINFRNKQTEANIRECIYNKNIISNISKYLQVKGIDNKNILYLSENTIRSIVKEIKYYILKDTAKRD